jgi:hypothetical protein
VAFAHCPNCQKAIRYQVEAKTGPIWLREFARAVGKGEPAVLMCVRCWFIPEIGDIVEVTKPRENELNIQVGDKGRVVEIQEENSAYPIFTVESVPNGESLRWRAQFMRWELRAIDTLIPGTLRFSLNIDGK